MGQFSVGVNSYSNKTNGRDAILDLIKNGEYSDIQELQSIQRLLATTPYAYGKDINLPPHMKTLVGIVADLTPIIGDAKAFYEAKDPFDYTLAVVGALGPAGDAASVAIRAAKAAHLAGNTAEATQQLNAAARLTQNYANGIAFQTSAAKALGVIPNTKTVSVTTRNGESITIIPDATINGLSGTLIEFKNVINISDTRQFRGYEATGQPITLVVSPRTETISQTVRDMVAASGGRIIRFDPATNTTRLF